MNESDITAVTGFWQRLDLPGLVDVHTHFMPRRLLTRVWEYFDATGPVVGRHWPITYRFEEDARLARIRAYGVRAFTAMIYPHKPGMAEGLNSWAADFASRNADCLHTATFFPEPEAGGYVARAIESGARIFKAHLQVGGYDPRDRLLDPVWGALEDSGTPVVVHCGSGPVLSGPFTGPGPILQTLERFPRLRLVIAHLGLPEYGEFLRAALRHPTVLLDTTMAFTDFIEEEAPFPMADLPLLAELRERILFGSDFPNIPYPYAHSLEVLEKLGLGDDWLRAVCHDNGAALFGL